MKTANALKDRHVPVSRDLLEYYNLSTEELIKGVFCPVCARLPMKRQKKQWYCLSCGHYSKVAHDTARNDYLLLVSDFITNRKAREFLKVESRDVMKRLLINGGYPLLGKKKNSRYPLVLKQEEIIRNKKLLKRRKG